jgi:alanine racemase
MATDDLSSVWTGKLTRHAANSGGTFLLPDSHFDMVRPGLSLYGIDPTGAASMDRKLRPAMKWIAPLIGIKEVPAGTRVGYCHTWSASRPTRVGLLPIGYGDGYWHAFSNRAVVMLHNIACPVIGRVSMDLTTIDLTDMPQVAVGDEATLLDDDPLSPLSVYKLAEWAQTIPYEIVTRIGQRVTRVAVD